MYWSWSLMHFTPERMTPLKALRLGIDTHHELIIYLRADCPVCRSEGFSAMSRVLVSSEEHHAIATLNIVTGDLLKKGQIGFSEPAWQRLHLQNDNPIWLSHPKPVQSMSYVRAKVYGHTLDEVAFQSIINDIVDGRYADVHVAAFVTACGDKNLSNEEITALTHAMIKAGSTIDWNLPLVVDKHCVGGLPGNRTTPIIVPILAACGLTMPKTSSRAITSPAGTADTMETLTNVCLSQEVMRNVVNQQGACLAWGGSMRLSPADDLLIQVERALDIDSEGQLIASVLSKKIAAGATHVLIDIPVGTTAKIRTPEAAEQLAELFKSVAKNLGLSLKVLLSDGSQPVGKGIGPALEAYDILGVLQNSPDAPQDLKQRACMLAGAMLEMIEYVEPGKGLAKALDVLENGHAWSKFKAICYAQGGLHTPPVAPYRYNIVCHTSGTVLSIDNRKLAQTAKLAGAPADPEAGVELFVKIGHKVSVNQILLTIHAANAGELNYAVEFLEEHKDMILITHGEETCH
jgi:thymidine phosphorylase